jgi:hypothetical protein
MPAGTPPGLSRRGALLRLAALAVAGLPIPAAQAQTVHRAALEAYIDTLLPGGGDGLPPASALGIPAQMVDLAAEGSLFARLLAAGTEWLDRLDAGGGGRPFAALPPATRAEVVAWMAAAPYDEIPGRFYHVVRLIACELYYADPAGRTGMAMHPAPQPTGYLPPWGEA